MHPAARVALALITIIIALIVYSAPVGDEYSDPSCSLVVSQSILENGTIKIDTYKYLHEATLSCAREYNGHYYDYFPLGTPVLSLPVVMAARSMGFDMTDPGDNASLQILMVTFIVPGIFLIIFFIGRLYVSAWVSLVISLVSVLGSSLVSTLGTALWSHCFATLLNAFVLLVIVRHDEGKKVANPYLLGTLLFLSYLTRPTASMFILMVFAYFFFKNRWVFIRTAAVSFFLLLCFVAFSYYEYSQVLPPYYLGRLNSQTPFLTALYGLLLSPARGLFIFSPFLIVVTGLAVYLRRVIMKNTLLLLLVLWSAAHVLMVTQFAPWWAGWSFGARILTDSLPAWILISFILWRELMSVTGDAWKFRAVAATYLALGLIAVFINIGQGLYNPWIQTWNGCIEYFERPEDALFSWELPQVLATSESVTEFCNKALNDKDRYFVTVKVGHEVPGNSKYDLYILLRNPKSCQELNTRALAYLKLGHLDKTMEDLERALSTFPDCAHTYETRGTVLLRSFMDRTGCRDLEKACDLGSCDNYLDIKREGYCN